MHTRISHRAALGMLAFSLSLAGCVSQGEYDKLQTENKTLQQQVSSQSSEIAQKDQELASLKQRVGVLRAVVQFTANSDLLFKPGSWQMSKRGQTIIGHMAEKLAPTQESKLEVNAYTDNTPIGARLKAQGITSNEELSQKRAESVAQFLISKGVNPNLLVEHGYGEANPIASNDTAAGRAKNRRVELALEQGNAPQ